MPIEIVRWDWHGRRGNKCLFKICISVSIYSIYSPNSESIQTVRQVLHEHHDHHHIATCSYHRLVPCIPKLKNVCCGMRLSYRFEMRTSSPVAALLCLDLSASFLGSFPCSVSVYVAQLKTNLANLALYSLRRVLDCKYIYIYMPTSALSLWGLNTRPIWIENIRKW